MPGRHARDVDVPEVEGPVDARVERDGLDRLRRVVALEEQQLDRRRVLREEREVRALGVGRRAERMRAPGSDGEAAARWPCSAGAIGRRHDVAASAIGGSSSTRFSLRLLRVERDDRPAVAGQGEALRLAVERRELPDLVGAGDAVADDQLADPGDRLRLVAQQVEPAVRADLEVAEVLADRLRA